MKVGVELRHCAERVALALVLVRWRCCWLAAALALALALAVLVEPQTPTGRKRTGGTRGVWGAPERREKVFPGRASTRCVSRKGTPRFGSAKRSRGPGDADSPPLPSTLTHICARGLHLSNALRDLAGSGGDLSDIAVRDAHAAKQCARRRWYAEAP